jgi:Ni/Fe-hydrogenase subunit HybB-like protein
MRQFNLARQRLSPTGIILGVLIVIGLAVALNRYLNGLGAISNLSDAYPWGLWISFDILCGVALAAGAFTTAGAVYLLGAERLRPILRPAILTGLVGYLLVIVALLVALGRPERIWHLLIYWNPHSVMFEVGWCVMLYTTVLALEFSPLVFERLGWRTPLRLIHVITIPLVIAGVVLSTLHQSSLGSLFLIVPGRLDPLWYSALLPVLFFASAAAAGPAMVIVESIVSSRAFNRELELDILGSLSKAIPYILGLYLILKIGDLIVAGEWGLLFAGRIETLLFWAEILSVVAPLILFSLASTRQSVARLFWSAVLVVASVVLNRFNVSLFWLARPAEAWYFPHWMEFAITLAILSGGVVAYGLVARVLPLFVVPEHTPGESRG